MYSVEIFDKLKAIHEKIKSENTGSRAQFAKDLQITEHALWRYIGIFKERKIPVKFSKRGNTYFYDINENEEVRIVWEFRLLIRENHS